MKTIKPVLLFLVILAAFPAVSQTGDSARRQKVLEMAWEGKEVKFGKWDGLNETETRLRYIGKIKTDSGYLKIMTSQWIWGHSHRSTNRILIFSNDNIYLGNYYLESPSHFPTSIKDHKLYFSPYYSYYPACKKKTVVSFKKGIPQFFLHKCGGVVYEFNSAE